MNEDITTTFSDGLDPKCRCTGLGMAQTGPGLEPFHEFWDSDLPLNVQNKMLRFLGPFPKVGLGSFF